MGIGILIGVGIALTVLIICAVAIYGMEYIYMESMFDEDEND